jgi:hypothetical protein
MLVLQANLRGTDREVRARTVARGHTWLERGARTGNSGACMARRGHKRLGRKHARLSRGHTGEGKGAHA